MEIKPGNPVTLYIKCNNIYYASDMKVISLPSVLLINGFEMNLKTPIKIKIRRVDDKMLPNMEHAPKKLKVSGVPVLVKTTGKNALGHYLLEFDFMDAVISSCDAADLLLEDIL